MVEDAGFASFWVMDHFFQIPRYGAVDEPMVEAYAALACVAALTTRIRIGTMVTGVTYRHPGPLVKTVSTLDVLSGGRGERKTLKLVARYGAACNFTLFGHPPDLSAPAALEEVAHKLAVLRSPCDAEGRSYGEIERTVLGWLPVTVDGAGGTSVARALDVLAGYADLGVDHVLIATSTLFPSGPDPALFARFAEGIVPRARELPIAGRA